EVRRAGKSDRPRARHRAAQWRSDSEQRRDLRDYLQRSAGALHRAPAPGVTAATGSRESSALPEYLDQAAVRPGSAAAGSADGTRVDRQNIKRQPRASRAAARNAAPGT